ncbi:MAG TPA: peptidase [Allosphingosinicella sp.]|jgi:hypothetical protein|nr:peptidase [Allosphingosinicella sp.]
MSLIRLRAAALLLVTGIGLSACTAYDDYGYGYGGLSVGYGAARYCDPYWDDCYYGRGGAYGPWYGWYGDYYYPGFGIYVYDRYRRPHRWNDDHRRYWEGRRSRYGDRNWNDRRWERWDGWDRSRGGEWRGRGGEWRGRGDDSGWRDRSSRSDWNENRSYRDQGVRTESGTRTETRVRTEGSRVRTGGARPRGEWRSRSEGARSRGGWRSRRD